MVVEVLHNGGGFPQYVSADKDNALAYWVGFDSAKSKYKLMKTYYSGTTMDLNISYPSEIKISQDMFHLYVLDVSNNRIDKYEKSSLVKVENITVSSGAKEIITGFGESSSKHSIVSQDLFYSLKSLNTPEVKF